jgi:hypothetical protein
MKKRINKLTIKKVTLRDLDNPTLNKIAAATGLECLTDGQFGDCTNTQRCTTPVTNCYYTCVNDKCV